MSCWLPRFSTLLSFIALVGCGPVADPAPPPAAPKSSDPAVSRAQPSDAPTTSKPTARVPANAAKPVADSQPVADAKPAPEELFAGWPEPQVALVITGNQYGYLEPCGCTGLANQKGGLARRHSLLKQLTKKGWEVVPLDAGNQVRRFGPQSQIQFHVTAQALQTMGYRAIGLGVDDLRLSGELVGSIASDDAQGPFTSSNVAVLDRELLPRSIVVKVGERKIGIVSVLGEEHRKKATAGEVLSESVNEGLAAALPALKEAGCDYRVLLAFALPEEAEEIARQHKVFDLVVASSGPTEPTFKPEQIEGTRATLVHSGVKGMYVEVIGLYDDPEQPIRYQRVPLDDRFPDSPEMLSLLADYQNQLEQNDLEGLGLKPQPHGSGRTFVGTQTCGECHTKALAVWEKTPHAHATDSLVKPGERSDIPRHFDPECLSCHVTGWNPQKFFPYTTGYLSVAETPAMMQNGCENCHGPGSEHVAAESNDGGKFTDDMIAMLRKEMRLPLAGKVAERKCMECHDLDNSPDFHPPGAFEKYWQQVEHVGKD